MNDEPLKGVSIIDFPGLESDRNPHNTPAAAVSLLNTRVGTELAVRKGLKPTAFSNAISATSNSIIAMSAIHGPEAEIAIYEDSAGNVKIGKNPS